MFNVRKGLPKANLPCPGWIHENLRWGKHPIAPTRFPAYSHIMKINHKQKALTLGEFIASVYDAHGKHTARGFVRLAIKAHLVEFCGQQRNVIS